MKTSLSFIKPAEIETECLVAVVLDHGEKDKPAARVAGDAALAGAASDAIRSGEMTGKTFESVLLHRPQG
ncbi:MAG: aminopeptidase, partial [Acidobacteriota bacterium]|nr:aminopeptidase [Acidobacteriota bacterium]